MGWLNARNPEKSRLSITETHMEWPRYELGTPAVRGERLTACAARQVMLELFSDSNGIVHMEFIPEGATINKTRYKEILGRLRVSIRRKCREFLA